MVRQLMDNSLFEIPSLDHPASSLYAYIRGMGGLHRLVKKCGGQLIRFWAFGSSSVSKCVRSKNWLMISIL